MRLFMLRKHAFCSSSSLYLQTKKTNVCVNERLNTNLQKLNLTVGLRALDYVWAGI